MNTGKTFYERLLSTCKRHNVNNMQQLADYLGYKSGEKLYRLERDEKARPSFSILLDLATKFFDIDLYWLITGNVQETEWWKNDRDDIELIAYIYENKKRFMDHESFKELLLDLKEESQFEKLEERVKELENKIKQLVNGHNSTLT